MIEILYRTATPEKGQSECFVLVLTPRAGSSRQAYAFMEEHGRWDEDLQHFLYRVNSICTDEGLTYESAWSMYKTAKQNLAGNGFIHSIVLVGPREEPAISPLTGLGNVTDRSQEGTSG
jgi:hypothetical protein